MLCTIYGTLLYMKPPCKDAHTLMETLPLEQSMVASTSIRRIPDARHSKEMRRGYSGLVLHCSLVESGV